MDTANTATISYLPVCTNCNTIIWDKIDYKEPDLEIEQNSRHLNYSALHSGEVQPRKCVNCGAIFTSIEIPTKLPFDNRRQNDECANKTVSIKTDDGYLCCDACGYEIHEGDHICEHCKRVIDWEK